MEINNPAAITDQGPKPYIVNIEVASLTNTNYRTALWTGTYLQATLMSIPVGGDIGLEVHPDTDQFLRLDAGQGLVQYGPSRDNLNEQAHVQDGYGIFVPAGTWHNLINTGTQPIKLYTIYAPPHHPLGTVHPTKEAAMAVE